MSAAGGNCDKDFVHAAAEAFELGQAQRVWPLGGTATPKYAVEVPCGRYVVRVRPAEFAGDGMTRFDHQVMLRLAAAGLPVPCPQKRPAGTTWLRLGGRVVEVLSWLEGEPFSPGDRVAVRNIGRFLARFHAVILDDIPVKKGFVREDHPDFLLPYVRQIEELCRTKEETEQVRRIGGQIELVRENLERQLWPRLPKAVVHGDIHPGNVRFQDSRVVAVYDFDYLSVQARVVEIAHALMFFGARHDSPFDPDDIYSLTQPFTLDEDLSHELLAGYQEIGRLADLEWEAMPWAIRSLWAQCRLRGSRKVPMEKKVSFVLDRYFEAVEWLDRVAPEFFACLRVL